MFTINHILRALNEAFLIYAWNRKSSELCFNIFIIVVIVDWLMWTILLLDVVVDKEVQEQWSQYDEINDLKVEEKSFRVAARQNSDDAVTANQHKLNELHDRYYRFYEAQIFGCAFEAWDKVIGIHDDVYERVDRSVVNGHQFWKKRFFSLKYSKIRFSRNWRKKICCIPVS
jgi:hypothetical protein